MTTDLFTVAVLAAVALGRATGLDRYPMTAERPLEARYKTWYFPASRHYPKAFPAHFTVYVYVEHEARFDVRP